MRKTSLPLVRVNQRQVKKNTKKFEDMSYEERKINYAKSLAHLNKPREEVIRDSWGKDD